MAIPIGNLAVSASRALSGLGRGKIAGIQIEQDQADKERQRLAEALRLSLTMQTAQRGEGERGAMQQFLATHGSPDLTGLPAGAAMQEYGRRQPSRPSASEGRIAGEAQHRARVLAAKGEAEGLVVRFGRSLGAEQRNPRFIFDFLRRKFPDLADADLWDIVGDLTIPKKPAAAGPLDIGKLKSDFGIE